MKEIKKLREERGVFLSDKALELQEFFIDKYRSFPPSDEGVRFNREWTLIPKDFNLVATSLQLYQFYLRDKEKQIPAEVFDWLTDFAEFQELLFALHDGRKA
jgi:hypothetical protein